jgi:hypothetical protein
MPTESTKASADLGVSTTVLVTGATVANELASVTDLATDAAEVPESTLVVSGTERSPPPPPEHAETVSAHDATKNPRASNVGMDVDVV